MTTCGKAISAMLCLLVLYGFDCPQSFFLNEGDTATCTGILVPELQLSLMREEIENTEADIEYCKTQRVLDRTEFDVRLSQVAKHLAVCETEIDALRATALETANLAEPEVPWYESVAFVVSITAIISVGLAVGFYSLADHLAEQE